MRVRLTRLSPSAPYYEKLAREGRDLAERTKVAVWLATADDMFARDVAERGIKLGDVGTITQVFDDGWVEVRFEGMSPRWAKIHVAEALLEEVTEDNKVA